MIWGPSGRETCHLSIVAILPGSQTSLKRGVRGHRQWTWWCPGIRLGRYQPQSCSSCVFTPSTSKQQLSSVGCQKALKKQQCDCPCRQGNFVATPLGRQYLPTARRSSLLSSSLKLSSFIRVWVHDMTMRKGCLVTPSIGPAASLACMRICEAHVPAPQTQAPHPNPTQQQTPLIGPTSPLSPVG